VSFSEVVLRNTILKKKDEKIQVLSTYHTYMIFVIVFVLSTSICLSPPCVLNVYNRKYRELVFDPRKHYQKYASLPLHQNFAPVSDNQAYWIEEADTWISHNLQPTIGNRTVQFYSSNRAVLTVLTRGLSPVIMLDDVFLGTEELIRFRLDPGDHSLIWVTSRRINPTKGDGFQEPVQTAAWLKFAHQTTALVI
jgi:hypothetical protein